jgi:conjugative relaxase-like TrwC/TraI family protein
VLSISKLSTGQHRYYLEQAEGRVDVVDSVGDGVEEYYVGGSEARGEWLGTGARQLGLPRVVEGEALRRVLAGEDSHGEVLRASRVPIRVAGYDLTFSAPKSVSVLFALGDADVRDAVRSAHDRAVREALGYTERTAAAVRRGAGGARVEPADGFVAAAFRHRTSRAGDPQLHTHVLVANLAQGLEGRWSTLDGRRLYAQARAASFVYQAVLRSELSRHLGVQWLSIRDGIAEVAGVPKHIQRAFSRRRADIEAALEQQGTSGARASEAAALATRQAKDAHTTLEALAIEWRARAADLGFGRDDLARTLDQRRVARDLGEQDVDRLFDALASPTGLTRRKATFSRRDVVQALSERLPADLELSASRLEALAGRFLSSDRVVALLPADAVPETRLSFRRRDGRVLPLAREECVYSTPELLTLERRIMNTAVASQAAGAGPASDTAVRRALMARPTLGADQRTMIEHLCLGGARVSAVVGKAGTGKTYALVAAREAWQASSRPVLGVAVARRAANQLQADSGIATTSVAALLAEIERPHGALPDGAVLVVDEAGMLPTRQLGKLLEAVEQADGKLVLVGDHRQLQELEAGGTFRALVRRGHAVELTENRRQREAWERRALDQLREGDPEHAIQAYVAHDRVHIARTPDDTRRQLVADWRAARAQDDAVMIAQRRSDVADLNQRARELLRRAGELGGSELCLPGGRFAVGDLVVIKRNDQRLGVTNGERGRVLAVDTAHQRLAVRLGDVVATLDRGLLAMPTIHGDPPLTHGYAITCHVAQGLTVDRAFVLADDALTSELGYTALSRGRHSNRLYLAEHPDDPRAEYAPTAPAGCTALERLTDALRTSRATVLAIDTGHPDPADLLAGARRELAAAGVEREEVERRRRRPGGRERLEAARQRESALQQRVEELTRAVAEQRHAVRPFTDEPAVSQCGADQRDRLIERRLGRTRSRGIER